MKKVFVIVFLFSCCEMQARNCNFFARSLTDTLEPANTSSSRNINTRKLAREKIKSAGWCVTGSLAVFGAALGLKDRERERAEPDIVGHKGRSVLGDVLIVVSGILLAGALVLFISWLGMKKGKGKDDRISFIAPPKISHGNNSGSGFGLSVRLGRK